MHVFSELTIPRGIAENAAGRLKTLRRPRLPSPNQRRVAEPLSTQPIAVDLVVRVDAMMAGVAGNVIALVFSVLVALPVGPESVASHLVRDSTALAVAETAPGAVLVRVKCCSEQVVTPSRSVGSRTDAVAIGNESSCCRRPKYILRAATE
jgi:hypothetical protein